MWRLSIWIASTYSNLNIWDYIYRAIVGNSFLSFFNKIQLLDFQGHLEENVPGVYVCLNKREKSYLLTGLKACIENLLKVKIWFGIGTNSLEWTFSIKFSNMQPNLEKKMWKLSKIGLFCKFWRFFRLKHHFS